MKKRNIICLVFLLVIMFAYENVSAKVTWQLGGQWDTAREKYFTQNCKLSYSPTTVKVRFSINGQEKYGTIYKHSDGNFVYFCLNPRKGGTQNYSMFENFRVGDADYEFKVNGTVHSSFNVSTQNLFKNIVYWYINYNSKYGNEAYFYAQTAIWYIAENHLTSMDQSELKEGLRSAYLTSLCSAYESDLRVSLSNPDFSCNCFKSQPGTSDFNKYCKKTIKESELENRSEILLVNNGQMRKENSQKGPNDTYKYLSLTDYEKKISRIAKRKVDDFDGFVDDMIDEMMNRYSANTGTLYLYFFEPISNPLSNQLLIGLFGCRTAQNSCSSDIKKLLTTFPNVNTRNVGNNNYWSQLQIIQNKYKTAIPASRLNIAEFVANPYCKVSCESDVEFYKSLLSTNSPSAPAFYAELQTLYPGVLKGDANDPYCENTSSSCEIDLEKYKQLKLTDPDKAVQLFLEMQMKYPEFNKDEINPRCDTPDPYKCDAYISMADCDFTSVITGFEMKDTSVERCWKELDISFNTDTIQETSKWKEASNEFCDVYCYEEFKSQFPGGKTNIKAGQQFFWGLDQPSGYFGNISATRKCYTKNIKYEDWIVEFQKNEIYIIQKYNTIVAKRKFNLQTPTEGDECQLAHPDACEETPGGDTCLVPCNADALREWCGSCSCDGKNDPNCGKDGDPCKGLCGGGSACCGGAGKSDPNPCGKCSSGYNWSGNQCYETGKYCVRAATDYISNTGLTNISYTSDDIKGSQGEVKKCYKTTVDCGSDTVKGELTVSITTEETELTKALLKRKELITKITSCQSNEFINVGTIYDYQTKVVLTYQDPTDKSKNRNISGDVAFRVSPSKQFSMTPGVQYGPILIGCAKLYSDNGQTDIEDVNTELYRCNDDYSITIIRYNDYTWDFSGQWDYYYDSELFTWKYLKENGLTYNTRTYNEKYTDFYSHNGTYGFVTAWSLVTGFYTFGEVKVNTFGNYYNGKGHFDELFKENNNGDDTYTYSCPFHIENEFYGSECHFDCDFITKECKVTADSPEYCDDEVGGIDVVYRVIELNKDTTVSFPGIVGTGRKQGTNWATFISERVEKFNNIMNYSNIYKKNTIYSIDLTPSLMQEIRTDNQKYRKEGKDPYTVMRYPDNTKKIVCDGNAPKDQTCASKWLSSLSSRGILTGIYGSIKDTDERLARIKTDKNSNAASGGKTVAVGGA